MRYKGCHQAHNAQVAMRALFTTRNSLKLQGGEDSKTEFNGFGGLRTHIGISARFLPPPALLNYGPSSPGLGPLLFFGHSPFQNGPLLGF